MVGFDLKRQKSVNVGSKKVAELLAAFDPMSIDIDFEAEEVTGLIAEMATTGQGRSPEELDNIATENFVEAFRGVKVAVVNDEGQQPVLAEGSVTKSQLTEDVNENVLKSITISACVFAFLHGSVTNGKYWFLVGKKGSKKRMYASLPLNVEGKRSTLVHVFRGEIGKLLEKHDNVLISALKRSGVEVSPVKRKYCFPKGHLLLDKPELIPKVRGEVSNMFEQLKKKNVDDRKFDVPWFTSDKM